MRVFVTGASGFIGSAVVPELIDAGHEVVGLARSDASATSLEAAGVAVVRGSLDDLDTLRDTAAASDGVIHLAFQHEEAFSGNFPVAVAADQAAIEALAGALEGSDKPLVIASGLAGHPSGSLITEDTRAAQDSAVAGRMRNEEIVLGLADKGVRSASVRLSPTVHGEGDGGFVAAWIGSAREAGVAGYVAGEPHWPAVHRFDAARLFRLAVESAPAGSVLHGVAEEGVSLRDVAEVLGRHLDLPVQEIGPDAAAEQFGWLANFLGLDIHASSARTRELLGWEPTHSGLIEDLEEGHYFA